MDRLAVYIDRRHIAQRVQALGRLISEDHPTEDLVLVAVLKGSFMFAADLVRTLTRPARIEFLGVQSYGDGTETSGAVRITHDLTRPIANEHVVVVEDIVDTGLTARYLLDQLRSRGARSVKLCALLHKPARSRVQIPIDYLGFTVEDEFLVGYGLDLAQRYRTLPDLCLLQQSDSEDER